MTPERRAEIGKFATATLRGLAQQLLVGQDIDRRCNAQEENSAYLQLPIMLIMRNCYFIDFAMFIASSQTARASASAVPAGDDGSLQ